MESKESEAKIRALRTKRGKSANFDKWAAFHIDDLTALVTAEVERAKGIEAYMTASTLLENVGYLIAHRSQGGLPEMTAEVIGLLYEQIKAVLAANEKYVRPAQPQQDHPHAPLDIQEEK